MLTREAPPSAIEIAPMLHCSMRLTMRFAALSFCFAVLLSFSSCAPPIQGSGRNNPKDGLRYVWIANGSFEQGCSKFDEDCVSNEKPAHITTISKGFWIGQTEVTAAAYKRYSAATHRQLPPIPTFGDTVLNAGWAKANLPIVNVNWQESKEYCEWMGGRLPTEAQWEYAARAGTAAATYGDVLEGAWFGDNSGLMRIDAVAVKKANPAGYLGYLSQNKSTFHEVALKGPNSAGLYDMLGNVWEWTADWYGERYYDGAERSDPMGAPNGQARVLRGGSWVDTRNTIRLSIRGRREPGTRSVDTGFRCVW